MARLTKYRPRRGSTLLAALLTAGAVVAPCSPADGYADDGPTASASTTDDLPAPDSNGITLDDWTPVWSGGGDEPTLHDARMTTDAIFVPGDNPSIDPVTVPADVRIMLPADYDADRNEPYPVLYLLHGGNGRWSDWDTGGRVRQNLDRTLGGDGFPGIVVMPEGGRSGWYTDWYGEADGQFAPAWETFHIDQLLPWIDANFNTSGNRDGRAIAGVSMGGLGALMYSGRHTSEFSAVGSFSGGTNIREADAQKIVSDALTWLGATVREEGEWDRKFRVHLPWWMPADQQIAHRMEVVFGPPDASGNWPGRNPYLLASAYNAYDGQFVHYAGTGAHWWDFGEANIGRWNSEFHEQLKSRGVDHIFCTGRGGHDWDDWEEELVHFVDRVYSDEPPTSCPNGWGAPQD